MFKHTDSPDKVQQVVSILERGRWDAIEVTEHAPAFWIVRATRHAGSLAETSCSAYVSTRRSARGSFRGGYYDSLGTHKELKSWRTFRIWSGI